MRDLNPLVKLGCVRRTRLSTLSINSRGFALGFPKMPQSGQYHTIVKSRVRLTWYQSHSLNLVMSIEFSNIEQRTPKEKGVEPQLRRDVVCSRGGVG